MNRMSIFLLAAFLIIGCVYSVLELKFPLYKRYFKNIVSIKFIQNLTVYDKSKTITFEKYLNTEKHDSDILNLDNQNNVVFNDKVVLTSSGVPLNRNSAYTYTELRILIEAEGAKPRKGCDPNNTQKNGIMGLGCYTER